MIGARARCKRVPEALREGRQPDRLETELLTVFPRTRLPKGMIQLFIPFYSRLVGDVKT